MMAAIRSDMPAAGTLLNAALASNHAFRTDPDLARKRCPLTRAERAEDPEIAEYLLEQKLLYTRALKEGRTAMAKH